MPTTLGVSPKAVAAALTAYVAPIVAGFIASTLGVDIDASTATTFIGPLVLAAVTFAAAYAAKAGIVHVDGWPDPNAGPNPPVKEDRPDVGVKTPTRKKK
jgi:hypothetical protein